MTDPNDFLDPVAEPELEPELEHAPDRFFSMATLLRNLPFMVALALAIFGVAYSNFSGHTINGYLGVPRNRNGACVYRHRMAQCA